MERGKFGKLILGSWYVIGRISDHGRLYLFFWDFQGFQVIAYDTEFLFKLNNFTAKRERRKNILLSNYIECDCLVFSRSEKSMSTDASLMDFPTSQRQTQLSRYSAFVHSIKSNQIGLRKYLISSGFVALRCSKAFLGWRFRRDLKLRTHNKVFQLKQCCLPASSKSRAKVPLVQIRRLSSPELSSRTWSSAISINWLLNHKLLDKSNDSSKLDITNLSLSSTFSSERSKSCSISTSFLATWVLCGEASPSC